MKASPVRVSLNGQRVALVAGAWFQVLSPLLARTGGRDEKVVGNANVESTLNVRFGMQLEEASLTLCRTNGSTSLTDPRNDSVLEIEEDIAVSKLVLSLVKIKHFSERGARAFEIGLSRLSVQDLDDDCAALQSTSVVPCWSCFCTMSRRLAVRQLRIPCRAPHP